MLEREWQKQVIEIAHLFRWKVAHFRPARTNKGWVTPVAADGKGFPDMVLVRDRVIFAELKAVGKYPSPEQRAWRGAIETAGGEYYLWRPDNADDVIATLR